LFDTQPFVERMFVAGNPPIEHKTCQRMHSENTRVMRYWINNVGTKDQLVAQWS
jgi:hypothetical protein